jgi:hypothetical protein
MMDLLQPIVISVLAADYYAAVEHNAATLLIGYASALAAGEIPDAVMVILISSIENTRRAATFAA